MGTRRFAILPLLKALLIMHQYMTTCGGRFMRLRALQAPHRNDGPRPQRRDPPLPAASGGLRGIRAAHCARDCRGRCHQGYDRCAPGAHRRRATFPDAI